MLEKLSELNDRLIKLEDRMEASIKKIPIDPPSRCGLVSAIAILALLLFALFSTEEAQAKCTKRVADPLITSRYQECNSKKMLSYLYNDLVTPYSFNCAKKITATCKAEKCSNPTTPEETARCQGLYVQVLDECVNEIEGAAMMARCKDTKAWSQHASELRASQSAPPESITN